MSDENDVKVIFAKAQQKVGYDNPAVTHEEDGWEAYMRKRSEESE